MKLRTNLSALLSCAAFAAPLSSEPVAWQGNEAYFIEAEEAVLTSPMAVASDTEASGEAYIWTPTGHPDAQQPPVDGHATFVLHNIPEGTYHLWGRFISPDSNSNSFFLQINGGDDLVWETAQGAGWFWEEFGQTFQLDFGTHEIAFKRRESGTKLDKIILTQNPTYIPSGLGEPLAYATPGWWTRRGVISPEASADDFAIATIGQLKHIAAQAYYEFQDMVPEGAGTDIRNMVQNWLGAGPSEDNLALVNLGQAKHVASLFYDRLQAKGLASGYPWPEESPLADDYALATIGQIKYLFSFDLDIDNDGLPDWWEMLHFGHLNYSGSDVTQQGLRLRHEYIAGMDPTIEPLMTPLSSGPECEEQFCLDTGSGGKWHLPRTVVMEYCHWIESFNVPQHQRALTDLPAGDTVRNIRKFALEIDPLQATVSAKVGPLYIGKINGKDAIEVVRHRHRHWHEMTLQVSSNLTVWNDVNNVIIHDTRAHEDEAEWEWVTLLNGDDPPGGSWYRIVYTLRNAPTIFAHYQPGLWPGTWAMNSHMRGHEPRFAMVREPGKPARQNIPANRRGFDQYLEFPLIRPSVRFGEQGQQGFVEDPIVSAKIDIRRAQHAGFDGFAVVMWAGDGGEGSLEPLFEAAYQIHQADLAKDLGAKPFQISVVPDAGSLGGPGSAITWNCSGTEEDNLASLKLRRSAAATGIRAWLDYLDKEDKRFRPYVAHRGGMPMVMGYGSFQWVDNYLGIEYKVGYCGSPTSSDHALAFKTGNRPEEPDPGRLAWAAFAAIESEVSEQPLFWQFDFGGYFHNNDGNLDYDGPFREEIAASISKCFPAVNLYLPMRQHGTDLTEFVRAGVLAGGAEWGQPLSTQRSHAPRRAALDRLRDNWYDAIGFNFETGQPRSPVERSSLIQATTWNDYGEWSHIAPGMNTRYTILELNRYFISQWKRGEPPQGFFAAEDPDDPYDPGIPAVVMVLHRKYQSYLGNNQDVTFFPFEGAEVPLHGSPTPEKIGNVLEAIVILKEPAGASEEIDIEFANRLNIPAVRIGEGLQLGVLTVEEVFDDIQFNAGVFEPGPVIVEVTGLGDPIVVTSPERITDRPFRQDLTLVGFSNVCERNWKNEWSRDFIPANHSGEKDEPFLYAEYNIPMDDGIPSWFRRWHFGWEWFDLSRDEMAFLGDGGYVCGDPNGQPPPGGGDLWEFQRAQCERLPPIPQAPYNGGWTLTSSQTCSLVQAEDFDDGGVYQGYGKAAFVMEPSHPDSFY